MGYTFDTFFKADMLSYKLQPFYFNIYSTKGTSSQILRRTEQDRVKWCAMKR